MGYFFGSRHVKNVFFFSKKKRKILRALSNPWHILIQLPNTLHMSYDITLLIILIFLIIVMVKRLKVYPLSAPWVAIKRLELLLVRPHSRRSFKSGKIFLFRCVFTFIQHPSLILANIFNWRIICFWLEKCHLGFRNDRSAVTCWIIVSTLSQLNLSSEASLHILEPELSHGDQSHFWKKNCLGTDFAETWWANIKFELKHILLVYFFIHALAFEKNSEFATLLVYFP